MQQSQLCCFSHTYIASTLLKTCRPTREGLTVSSCLSHAVTSDTANCPVRTRPTYASNTSDGRQREMATGGLCAISLHSTSDYRPNDRRSYLKFSLWRWHWSTNKTTAKEWWTIPLIECVYAPCRETNSPPAFIPSLQHEAQTWSVMLQATSKEWAISGRSTGPSNCDYGAMHTGG